jgi:hypothetical protein
MNTHALSVLPIEQALYEFGWMFFYKEIWLDVIFPRGRCHHPAKHLMLGTNQRNLVALGQSQWPQFLGVEYKREKK